MQLLQFNINLYVRVKLKDEGIKLLSDYYNMPIEDIKSIYQDGIYFKFQMWEFMRIYGGRNINIGGNVPFYTDILFDLKDLKALNG